MNAWTNYAVGIADASGVPSPMPTGHLETLAECALGPTRKRDGAEDRPYHLEHIANYDVPLLIREIVRLRGLVTETDG